MTKTILLTGSPGCGKTTLLRRVLAACPGKVGGFYTEEIREAGIRKGFKLVTLNGQDGMLAHVDIKSPTRLGKYRLDLSVLGGLGIESLWRALAQGHVVVIDEIGPMELKSALFRQTVLKILDQAQRVLATIVRRDSPFTAALKSRADVTLIEVTPSNREALVQELVDELGSPR
jgi:nucleoside-triphosphatase